MSALNLKEYGQRIFKSREMPDALDTINIELSGWYANIASEMAILERQEAVFWQKHKGFELEKPRSDAYVNALWRVTEEGMKHSEIGLQMKTIEKLMSTIRSSLARADREFRAMK